MHRAKKAGIALQIQKKLEVRYDEEDGLGTPDRIMEWMNKTLEGIHPPCPSAGFRKFQFYLRDGIALCRFINILLESDGKHPVKYSTNSNTAFVAMENIENFNRGAELYGVPKINLFNSIDLYEGIKGPFLHVINCLNKLGFVANEKKHDPAYDPGENPVYDAAKWAKT